MFTRSPSSDDNRLQRNFLRSYERNEASALCKWGRHSSVVFAFDAARHSYRNRHAMSPPSDGSELKPRPNVIGRAPRFKETSRFMYAYSGRQSENYDASTMEVSQ